MSENKDKLAVATFAGGCFWCMEHPFKSMDGVREVVSGYTGGKMEDPAYSDVVSGITGHYEAIRITFDPKIVSYDKLLELFWMQIDPTDPGGAFLDRGEQYRSAIFYHDEYQKACAEASKMDLENSGRFLKPVVTRIIRATQFYKAEEYHQDYHRKNPLHYQSYRSGSGRDRFLNSRWGDNPFLGEKK